MKKILGLAAALVIGMSSLFAWTNIITLGMTGSIPTVAEPVSSDYDTITFTTGGINIDYIGLFDSGLAVMSKTTCGFGRADSDLFSNIGHSYGPYAISGMELLGVGYGVVNQDNLFVGVFGTAGYIAEAAFTVGKDSNTVSAGAVVLDAFVMGANVTAVYSPCKVFSLFASLSVNAGMGYIEQASGTADYKALKNYKDGDELPAADGDAVEYPVNPFVKIMPSIGIAWRF